MRGRCEKIRVDNEIGFPRCPGDGKICAAKIGGTRKPVGRGSPGFRKGTRANWGQVTQVHKNLPKGAAKVESPARKEEITASFWQANFSGPWTWAAFFISLGPDFFAPSGLLGKMEFFIFQCYDAPVQNLQPPEWKEPGGENKLHKKGR